MENIKVAIIAIARLENAYINEWIGHHLGIGVNHIYVYDNSSSEEEKLDTCVDEKYSNQVTIIQAYDKLSYQRLAYKEAYEQFNSLYDYLIYIDIDEFIMLQKDNTIQELIKRFPSDCECYRMNRLAYGDSGIIQRDIKSSVVKDFTIPAPDCKYNHSTKSIVKCGLKNIRFRSCHYPTFIDNGEKHSLITYCGDMYKLPESRIEKRSGKIDKIDYTYVRVNHYLTKSIYEYLNFKSKKPSAKNHKVNRFTFEYFFKYNEKTQEKIDICNKYNLK